MFINFTITQSYYVIILYLLSIYILYQKPIFKAESHVQCHLALAKSHVKQLGAHLSSIPLTCDTVKPAEIKPFLEIPTQLKHKSSRASIPA